MGRCPFGAGVLPWSAAEQMPLGYDVPPLSLRASAHAGVGLRPPTKKEIPFGISFLRSQDFFLLTYTIPVRDSAALTAYIPTPASMVLGEPVLPSSFAVVVEL